MNVRSLIGTNDVAVGVDQPGAAVDRLLDARVRTAAFNWLSEQVGLHGDVLPRGLLAHGFELDTVRVPLLGPQGIFKPKVLDVPLSLTTSPDSPYDDAFGEEDGLLHYRYRGNDPDHRDNRGMREAMRLGLPLAGATSPPK